MWHICGGFCVILVILHYILSHVRILELDFSGDSSLCVFLDQKFKSMLGGSVGDTGRCKT